MVVHRPCKGGTGVVELRQRSKPQSAFRGKLPQFAQCDRRPENAKITDFSITNQNRGEQMECRKTKECSKDAEMNERMGVETNRE